MEPLRIEKIAALCGGRLVRGNPKALALRVTTDTRSAQAGDCFVALRGDRFDGHDFLPAAARAGAVAVIVSRAGHKTAAGEMGCIEVDDTLRALHRLAGGYRAEMPMRVVAITGSNGKTTTKEMTAAVLARKFSVAKTGGNLNNHIGVPMSLLSVETAHEVGVFELGTSHPGEIAALAALARPDVAVVTNVGMAHVEFFGSTASVAREKGALVEALGDDGVAVLNADDEWTRKMARRCKGRVVTVGIRREADMRARAVEVGDHVRFTLSDRARTQEAEVVLPVLGRHQIYNALAACAVGAVFGMEMKDLVAGLGQSTLPAMRMQQEEAGGVRIFNDAYNANPNSMQAALAAFRHVRTDGRRIAVLGDMLELGEHARAAHEEVGEIVARTGHVKMLVTVGHLAHAIGESARRHGLEAALVAGFDTAEEAAGFLKVEARPGDCVLLKGSRRVGLERVADALRARAEESGWMEDTVKPRRDRVGHGKPTAELHGAGARKGLRG